MAPRHDPTTCKVCGPIVTTDAYRHGQARALALNPQLVTAPSPLMEQLQAGDHVDLEPHLQGRTA